MRYLLVVGEAKAWHIETITSRLHKEGFNPKVVNITTLDPEQLSSLVFEANPMLSVRLKRSRSIIKTSDIYGLISSQEEWDRASTIFYDCGEIFPTLCIWATIQADDNLEIMHGGL